MEGIAHTCWCARAPQELKQQLGWLHERLLVDQHKKADAAGPVSPAQNVQVRLYYTEGESGWQGEGEEGPCCMVACIAKEI